MLKKDKDYAILTEYSPGSAQNKASGK